MSVFLHIVRYQGLGRRRKPVDITEDDLEAAVKQIPRFKVVKEHGQIAVQMGRSDVFAELEDAGFLSSQIFFDETDTDQLLDALKKLAGKIPGAVVETEGGKPVLKPRKRG
jgi:hypothetical protein